MATDVDDAILAMFDQSGCDCAGVLYYHARWPAPYHASDCPVSKRFSPHERRLRKAAAKIRKARAATEDIEGGKG